jgi:CRP-like cAMP-binding protein
MAVVSGRARSADVRASTALTCLALDGVGIARLEREAPEAAFALLQAIARQLDSNLRMANTTILSLDR